ncbi:MAG: LysM peptidoglycan-binding domain-containing protein, partial [Balneolaceae bacterium]|nr:LysM peptidoglycan-binding domain-containing protein [Balneolaceae bacterium]
MKNLTNLFFNLKPALILCLILGFMSVPAFSQQTNDIHIVQQGESLFSIAREYGITVGDLRSWNNLETDNLQPGQTIRIAPPIAENQISHTVAQGETLFSISRQYGVTIAEIQQWNDLRSNNLDLGTELTIFLPEDESQGQEMETPLLPEERESIVRSADSSPANTYYTVRSGDTLFKIAGDHGMTIGELRNLNNLEGDLLRIGQQLIVRETESSAPSVAENAEESTPQGRYVQYRVQRGEDSSDLLQQFQMSMQELASLNPGVNLNNLSSGQRVTVLLPPSRSFANPYKKGASLQDLGSVPVFSYGAGETATPTTSGELYNPAQLTAAHANM